MEKELATWIYRRSQSQGLSQREERVLAQLRFAMQLDQEAQGGFQKEVDAATRLAQKGMELGLVDDNWVTQVEEALSPLAQSAKEYRFLCPAHAHIDMNWQWSYDETVMICLDTFHTILHVMEEYPEFKFSQSQASIYAIVEEYDPAMLEQIKHYIKEGRWEVTASTWVEADKNMPTGESFARHVLYTKDYLCSLLDLSPEDLCIDFEPDTFGHSVNTPEIDSKSGIKYYYHCRGNDDDGNFLYRWRSPSGGELLVYREPYFYNSAIDATIADAALELYRKTGSKTLLKVYGVGDHGGGPTRRDIEKLLEMNTWPIFPRIEFGTFRQYFEEMESIREKVPVLEGEINFICDGCYTSQSRIKAGNRKAERDLGQGEALSALIASFAHGPSQVPLYKKAWKKVLFNQFHDIVTGSCVLTSREHACGTYQEAQATLRAASKASLRQLCKQIDTSSITVEPWPLGRSAGAGSGGPQSEDSNGPTRIFHLFNSRSTPYRDGVEILLWDYTEPLEEVVFRDGTGTRLVSQFLETSHYWGHDYAKFLVEGDVPSWGYQTVVARAEPNPVPDFHYVPEKRRQHPESFQLENEKLRAVIDPLTGAVISLVDKATGRETLDAQRGGATLAIVDEANAKSICSWDHSMNSWFVGRHKVVEPISGDMEIAPHYQGELRNSYVIRTKLRDSSLTVEISLDKGSSHLNFAVTCDWREFGDENRRVPSLALLVPLADHASTYTYDVPFGLLDRQPMNLDRPANSFVVANTPENKVAVSSDSKYGFRCFDDMVCLRLLRSSTDPDPVPEIAIHQMQLSLGLVNHDLSPAQMAENLRNLYLPIPVFAGGSHPGTLPMTQSFLQVKGSVVVSAVKEPESGERGLILRVYNPSAQDAQVRVTGCAPVVSACFCDTLEREKPGHLDISQGTAIFSVRAFEVETILLQF